MHQIQEQIIQFWIKQNTHLELEIIFLQNISLQQQN